MELSWIFVRTNLRNWRKNWQQMRTNEITKRCPRGDLDRISIFSLQNEGYPTFCLCLTTGRHLGFTKKLRTSRSRRLFANSSWGNAATAFSLSSQFYVCGCERYKWYSGKCCILGKGRQLKQWASNIRFGYCTIFVASYQRLIFCCGACLIMDWLHPST